MHEPVTRALLAGGGLAVALLAAWALPAVAVVVVWPLLLVVPGWIAISLLAPRIDAAGRLGLAIVLTVTVSTHLVHVVSHLLGGYGRGSALAVAALLAATIPLTLWRRAGRPPVRAWRPAFPALLVAGAAALTVAVTLAVGMWRVTPGGVSSGGSNWSDLGVHLSIVQTLNSGGNFPPEVPYYAGAPLVYHWFADFHAAILAETAGVFAVPAMIVQSAVLAAALALLVFSLARRLLHSRGARRAAVLAAAVVVFTGGLGWIRLIGDLTVDPSATDAPQAAGDLVRLIATTSYDNQWLTGWPYFRIPSVMGTGLLAHRATTAGLPIVAGAMLLVVAALPTARQRLRGWRDRPALLLLAGLLGALLVPFHFFFFPIVPLLVLAWVATGGRLLDRTAPRNAALFALPYLLAIPFVLAPITQATGSGAVGLVAVWESAPRADGALAVAFFYVTNLGIPFGLAIAALASRDLPHRAFLAAWLLLLFLVPNVVRVSVIDFDMNKYFQAMWIAVGLLAAAMLRRWPLPAVALALLLSVPSPLLVAGWTATSAYGVLSPGELAASEWVAAETPPDAVFVTDGWVNSLTDAAGRKRLLTFGPYVANLGFDPAARTADVHDVYCAGDPEVSAELMRRHGATYVIDGGRPQPCDAPVDFATSDSFELAYDGAPRIWRLRDG